MNGKDSPRIAQNEGGKFSPFPPCAALPPPPPLDCVTVSGRAWSKF